MALGSGRARADATHTLATAGKANCRLMISITVITTSKPSYFLCIQTCT